MPARHRSPEFSHSTGARLALACGPAACQLLRNRDLGSQSLPAAAECLRVVAARGVALARYPEMRIFSSTSSSLGLLFARLVMRALFRLNQAVMLTSAHALADPLEIAEAYDDLTMTGRMLGVATTVMSAFEGDVRRYAEDREGTGAWVWVEFDLAAHSGSVLA